VFLSYFDGYVAVFALCDVVRVDAISSLGTLTTVPCMLCLRALRAVPVIIGAFCNSADANQLMLCLFANIRDAPWQWFVTALGC